MLSVVHDIEYTQCAYAVSRRAILGVFKALFSAKLLAHDSTNRGRGRVASNLEERSIEMNATAARALNQHKPGGPRVVKRGRNPPVTLHRRRRLRNCPTRSQERNRNP